MTESQQFSIHTRIAFGRGVARTAGVEVSRQGAKRILVVTDKHILGAGLLEGITAALRETSVQYSIFGEGEPDPSTEVVDRGVAILKREGAELLVAVGGGSNMDTAKSMIVGAALGRPIAACRGWIDKFQAQPIPIIAIPTTAGTAAEVTPFAVITDLQQPSKFWVGAVSMAPKVALLDPEMLTTAPRSVKIAAGMDALTHAVESFISKRANPYTEMCGLRAMELIAANLRAAIETPPRTDALAQMQIAANMAGMAFANAQLGIVHAAALPLGALFHVPHGIANAILLSHGMAFNRPACEGKLAKVATALGADVTGMSSDKASWAAIEAVRTIARDIGAPTKLREVGVKDDAFAVMAAEAIQNSHIQINPRQVTEQDLIDLYEAAL
jgi:alcohol dehydrogenase